MTLQLDTCYRRRHGYDTGRLTCSDPLESLLSVARPISSYSLLFFSSSTPAWRERANSSSFLLLLLFFYTSSPFPPFSPPPFTCRPPILSERSETGLQAARQESLDDIPISVDLIFCPLHQLSSRAVSVSFPASTFLASSTFVSSNGDSSLLPTPPYLTAAVRSGNDSWFP